jgi:hypothetical protein
MKKVVHALAAAASIAVAGSALAADAAPADAKPAEPAKPPPWYQQITVSGAADGYYQVRLDEAQTTTLQQRAFDAPLGFMLGDALLSVALAPGNSPAGFRVDLNFGNTANVIDLTSAAAAGTAPPTVGRYVLQAYASAKLGPVQLDLGRFTTSVGAEVVSAKDNWLYSRSLTFNLEPITHTGARVTVPLSDALSLQLGIVNGWDVVTTSYAGKTGEAQLAYAGPNGTALALTSYFGPNPTLWTGAPNTANEWRTIVDLVAGTTLGPLGLSLNVDWGKEASAQYVAGSLMARYSLPNDVLRITGRGEWVNDIDGVRFATGVHTTVWEVTGGIAAPIGSNAELRLEVRYDKASEPVFTPAKDTQTTGTIAALAWF